MRLLDEQPRTTLGGSEADALIEEARRRQRRRWWAVGAVLVAVTLSVGLLLGVNGPSLKGRSPGLQQPPVTFAGIVSSDHGALRLLGFHGLQIAVPARWRLEDQRCGTAEADTVLYPDLAFPDCYLTSPPHVTVVNFLAPPTEARLGWGNAALQTVADEGHKVLVGWLAATRQWPRLLVLYAPEVRAAITIQSPSAATAERLMASVRLVTVDANGCSSKVGDLRPAGPSSLLGASKVLVPDEPSGVALCRYENLWLARSVRESGHELSTLVGTLDGLKRGTSRAGRPVDAAVQAQCAPERQQGFLLRFSYASGALDQVFVHLNGCGRLAATNGSESGQIDERIVLELIQPLGYPGGDPGPVGITVPASN